MGVYLRYIVDYAGREFAVSLHQSNDCNDLYLGFFCCIQFAMS